MANKKISELIAASAAALTQLIEVTTDPSGTPASEKLTVAQLKTLFDTIYPANTRPAPKNIVINGDMRIAQRGTSFVSPANSEYTLDRWLVGIANGAFTVTQSTDAPNGFANSLKMECTTVPTLTGTQSVTIISRFEGQDLQFLKKGTADAESFTVSFWVKSSKTGTHILRIHDFDNSRGVSSPYTVDAVDTWEKKELTLPGDTSGVFDNDNVGSMMINFILDSGPDLKSGTLNTTWEDVVLGNLAVGQVKVPDTIGNSLSITGVQLEAGSTATDFDHRTYQEEKAACMRYFQKQKVGGFGGTFFGVGFASATTIANVLITVPVPLRAAPTIGNSTYTSFTLLAQGVAVILSTNLAANLNYSVFDGDDMIGVGLLATVASGLIWGELYALRIVGDANSYMTFDSEI